MKKILFPLLLGTLFSCSKKNDSTPVSLQTVEIHGYVMRDVVGNTIRSVGNPDIKIGDVDNFVSYRNNISISTFPNSSTDVAYAAIYMRQPAAKTKLWMVTVAYKDVPDQSLSALGGNQFVSSGAPVFELDSIPTTYGEVRIDVKNIPNGYYRLYFQADNIVLWDNIVISK